MKKEFEITVYFDPINFTVYAEDEQAAIDWAMENFNPRDHEIEPYEFEVSQSYD